MEKLIRVGMDTSKSVFVLHGVDAAEKVVLRKKLRRQQVIEFFGKLSRRRSAWRPAAQRIIGLASSKLWPTKLFCCRRNM